MQGFFENVHITITPIQDNGAMWTIEAKEVSYRIEADDNLILRIAKHHKQVKAEPDEEAELTSHGGLEVAAMPTPTTKRKRPHRAPRDGRLGGEEEALASLPDNTDDRPLRKRQKQMVETSSSRVDFPPIAESVDGLRLASSDAQHCATGAPNANSSERYAARSVAKNCKKQCNVEGCMTFAQGKVTENDNRGKAGPRCQRHGAPVCRCNVDGCSRCPKGKAVEKDHLGDAGHRCLHHGSPVPRCNVKGCSTFSKGKSVKADHLGDSGHRCVRHGAAVPRCNVKECSKSTHGKMAQKDKLGAAGGRCFRHRGTPKEKNITQKKAKHAEVKKKATNKPNKVEAK
eukprot:GEMP01043497.1.p1 GENE.GEMP01043497.1~~GEMP01043497.1.p1  ORF type:complete len:343 (+),score=73.38 GEMP01043497.1:24-1052(+)